MAEIPIMHRGQQIATALVDDVDCETLSEFVWSLHKQRGYACRYKRINGKLMRIYMHRQILGLDPGDPREGDHKNRDRLNNHRDNLRILKKGQNAQNRSKETSREGRTPSSSFRGVCFVPKTGKWHATVAGKYLGSYDDELVAADVAKKERERTLEYANN